ESLLFSFVNDGKHAIVGRDKILVLSADQQWAPLGSHARIHDHYMDGLWRKVGIRRANRKCAIEQVERGDVVRDVHYGDIRIDLQDDALQRSDEMVVGS